MIDRQQVYAQRLLKENNTWTLALETKNIQGPVYLESNDERFSLQDFYFGAVEMMEKQKYLER